MEVDTIAGASYMMDADTCTPTNLASMTLRDTHLEHSSIAATDTIDDQDTIMEVDPALETMDAYPSTAQAYARCDPPAPKSANNITRSLTFNDLLTSIRQHIAHRDCIRQIPSALQHLAAFMRSQPAPLSAQTKKLFNALLKKIDVLVTEFATWEKLCTASQENANIDDPYALLTASNDEYQQLIHVLLPDLRRFHMALQSLPAKASTGVRAELGRIQFEDAVREWGEIFEMQWVLLGGMKSDFVLVR